MPAVTQAFFIQCDDCGNALMSHCCRGDIG